MKKLFLILTYLFLSFNIMNAADLSNKADQPTIQEINEKSKQPDPKKKRMPGISQSIGIYYDNVRQECTFIMPSSISSISITLQSENEVMTGYVMPDPTIRSGMWISRREYTISCALQTTVVCLKGIS